MRGRARSARTHGDYFKQGQALFLYNLYTWGRGEGKESRAKSVFFLPVCEKESGQSTYIIIDIYLFNSEICFKYDNFQVINLLPWGLWHKDEMIGIGFWHCLKGDAETMCCIL